MDDQCVIARPSARKFITNDQEVDFLLMGTGNVKRAKRTNRDHSPQEAAVFLRTLVDYTKYLYEEEKERTTHLLNVMKTYLTIETFTVAVVVFRIVGTGQLPAFSKSSQSIESAALLGALYISLFFVFVSFICTILALKIRKFERPCPPKAFVTEAANFENQEELLSAINANYVVATERNYAVNQTKAKYLSYALRLYITGLTLFLLSFLFLFGI